MGDMRMHPGTKIICATAVGVFLGACDGPVLPDPSSSTPLEVEGREGQELTITISNDIFHDNITGVEPPDFAEVRDISGAKTVIFCKKAGKGNLVIRWNDRAPNADPSGRMITHVSTLTLLCRHAQGGGGGSGGS